MKKLLKLLLSLLVLAFTAGCHKNTAIDLNPNVNVANDVTIAECAFKYIFNMVIKAQTDSAVKLNHGAWIDSAWVVYNSNENEFEFTFSGKMSADSVRRTGSFEAEFDTGFLVPGSVTMILFNSYYDGYESVIGLDSIVDEGYIPGNRMAFRDYVKHGLIVKGLAKSTEIHWTSETLFTTNSNSFIQPGDIVFIMSGNASGISSDGYAFTALFDSLTDNLNCPWILDGLIHLAIPDGGYTSGSINFIANDGCTNKMTYDFGGITYYVWKNDHYLKN